MREDTKNKNREEGGEGEEEAARIETVDDRHCMKENDGRSGATDWKIRGPEENTQQRSPLDWNIRGHAEASGQAQGARTGSSGEERPWRGVSQVSNVQGCAKGKRQRRHERQEASQGEHEQEQETDGGGEEEKEPRWEQREGRRSGTEGDNRQRKKKDSTVPWSGTTEARKKPHSEGATRTGSSTTGGRGGKRKSARNPDWIIRGRTNRPATGPSRLEHPGPERRRPATGPTGLEHPGGRGGKRTSTRSPDWIIRGKRYRPATGPPGLDHPGG